MRCHRFCTPLVLTYPAELLDKPLWALTDNPLQLRWVWSEGEHICFLTANLYAD